VSAGDEMGYGFFHNIFWQALKKANRVN